MMILNLARRIGGLQLHRMAFENAPQLSDHFQQELAIQFRAGLKAMKTRNDSESAKSSFDKVIETSFILCQAHPHKAYKIFSIIANRYNEEKIYNDAIRTLKKAMDFFLAYQIPENATKAEKDIIQACISKINLQIGETYYFLGDLSKSDVYISKEIDSIKFPSPLLEAVAYNRLASIKVQLRDKEALKYAEKAVDICKLTDPEHELLGEFLCTLAQSHRICKNLIMAEKRLKEGIEHFDRLNTGRSKINKVDATEYLVLVLANQNKLSEAANLIIEISNDAAKCSDERKKYFYLKSVVPLFRNNKAARPIREILLTLYAFVPEESEEQIRVCTAMAEDLINSDENTEALVYAEKCLTLGKNRLDARIYILLSRIYLNLVDFNKSKAYIDMCESLLNHNPDRNIEIEMNYHQYVYYCKVQDYAEAEKCLKICIDGNADSFAPPDLLGFRYFELGGLQQVSNKLDKALDSFKKAHELITKRFGSKILKAADCMERIGSVYNNQKKFNDSLEYLFGALEIKTALCGEHGQEFISTYYKIAKVYFNMKENSLALEYAEKVPSIIQKCCEEGSPILGPAYLLIAEIYGGLMNRKKSKEFYVLARDIYLRHQYTNEVDLMNMKIADLNR